MIDGLKLLNIPAPKDSAESELLAQLALGFGDCFVLKTCQRTLIAGHNLWPHRWEALKQQFATLEFYHDEPAYQFLLQTICGLKSQVLAESEITAQFKEAYKSYLDQPGRSAHLMNVLEKLFKDAKEIRSRYLVEVGQQSYAGITRKILVSKFKQGGQVLVVGSGALARDVTKLLNKKFEIILLARNQEKMRELAQAHQASTMSWDELPKSWAFNTIINTVGADETLFDHQFFTQWQSAHPLSRQFIDLSSPTVIDTSMGADNGVLRLENIFSHGVILGEEKRKKVEQAQAAINDLVVKRAATFSVQFPFGWEEMSFV